MRNSVGRVLNSSQNEQIGAKNVLSNKISVEPIDNVIAINILPQSIYS